MVARTVFYFTADTIMGINSERKNGGKSKQLAFGLEIIFAVTIGLFVSTSNGSNTDNGTLIPDSKLKIKNSSLLSTMKDELCTTEECVMAAAEILKSMNKSVNPCDDFYQFSCGSWIKNNPIPDAVSSWSQYEIINVQLNRKIREILETEPTEKDPNSLKLAKQYYKICMGPISTSQFELKYFIEDILKLKDINATNFGRKLGELRRRTVGQFLITFYVDPDQIDSSKNIIYIDQPSFGLNRAYLTMTNNTKRIAYKELIKMVWLFVYPSMYNTPEDYSLIAEQIVEFETKIAQISTPPEDRRNETKMYNLMTLSELENYTANATMLNWEEFVSEIFKDVVQNHNIDLGHLPNLTVVVCDMKFIKELGLILSESAISNPQVIVNYLRWRFIQRYEQYSSYALRNIFEGTLSSSNKDRSPICTQRTNLAFGMAISYQYVQDQDVFNGDSRTQIEEMVENIRKSFINTLDETKWIVSEATRNKAKEKAKKINKFIGYPDWLLKNDTELDTYYYGLELNSSRSYFYNILQISKWRNMQNLKRLNEPKDSTRWITDPTTVNAFYLETSNSITVPVGILKPPFYFTAKSIQALNYGAIGRVIGHEMTHGFDDKGRQNDGDGNLVNWWDDETSHLYDKKAQCFIDQYSLYKVDEFKNTTINGENTLSENIGDNGGLHQSFKAYKSFVEKNGPELKLPGLDYNPDQLFFIAFAQAWCSHFTKEGMMTEIFEDDHSPQQFRVKGVLANSKEFADTWNCPQPDPQKMCKIW